MIPGFGRSEVVIIYPDNGILYYNGYHGLPMDIPWLLFYTILCYIILYYTIMVIMVVIIYPDNKYIFRFFPNYRLKIGGLPRYITDHFLFIIIIWIIKSLNLFLEDSVK